MADSRDGLERLTEAQVADFLRATDEDIGDDAMQDGDCLECGGWGRFWTINRDGRYGPLYPRTLPCAECGGTGRAPEASA